MTGQVCQLYNPRIQNWNEHFEIEDYTILGRTPLGRATVEFLKFNTTRRLQARMAEEKFGLFPPGPASSF